MLTKAAIPQKIFGKKKESKPFKCLNFNFIYPYYKDIKNLSKKSPSMSR